MTTYKKVITEEGKNEVLKIAFGGYTEGTNTFNYLALGTGLGGLASESGNKEDFQELDDPSYSRVNATSTESDNVVEFDENGTATISFTIDENNYNVDNGSTIKEIALCNSSEKGDIRSGNGKVFAFCEVPPIQKTGSISLKYTLKISIE